MSTTVTPPIDTHEESPLAHLSAAQLDELAQEFDTIRDRVAGELGERDRRYIEAMIEMQRRLAVIGRVGLSSPASDRSRSAAPRPSPRPRSSRTWRSATTSCTASGTG